MKTISLSKNYYDCYNGYSLDECFNAGIDNDSKYFKFVFVKTINGIPSATKYAYKIILKDPKKYEVVFKNSNREHKMEVVFVTAIGLKPFKRIKVKTFFAKNEIQFKTNCDYIKVMSKVDYDEWILQHPETKILDI
jgi:hypothetical protein